jgi:YHS domain-containing protein
MAGKWVCPMHPAVVRMNAGTCDVCGMNLVTTESLGYVIDTPKEAPLVIPASAPLITGTRAVVYVRLPDKEKPTFEGRQVTLGPRAGEYYLVKEGLAEGELVVTNGNFKIDASLQIQAKPSMMSAESAKENVAATEQTICPIMGGTINKAFFTEYKGKRVYFCCAGCKEQFEKEPEKYIAELPQFKQ